MEERADTRLKTQTIHLGKPARLKTTNTIEASATWGHYVFFDYGQTLQTAQLVIVPFFNGFNASQHHSRIFSAI
jgi:hypothetical protein